MKKIKFLRGYRGTLTNEKHYKKSAIIDIADSSAYELIQRGIAEYVTEAKAPVKKKPPAKKRVVRKKPAGKVSNTRGKK